MLNTVSCKNKFEIWAIDISGIYLLCFKVIMHYKVLCVDMPVVMHIQFSSNVIYFDNLKEMFLQFLLDFIRLSLHHFLCCFCS